MRMIFFRLMNTHFSVHFALLYGAHMKHERYRCSHTHRTLLYAPPTAVSKMRTLEMSSAAPSTILVT